MNLDRMRLSSTKWALIFVALFSLLWAGSAATSRAADDKWQARYWNNRTLSGDPVLRRDENAINHDWGSGSPDDTLFPTGDNFSARWTRSVNFPAGTYRFTATMDDGMRIWIDDKILIDSWTDSQQHTIQADAALSGGDHTIKVEYYEAGGKAVAIVNWVPVGSFPGQPSLPGNWHGEYYNGTTPGNNLLLVRDDPAINFNWGSGSPAPNIPSDRFSVRWTRNANLNAGRYRFDVFTDDGVKLWVNGQLIIDQWHDSQGKAYSGEIVLPGGPVPIQMDYYENIGDAQAHLTWTQLSGEVGPAQPTPGPSPTVGTATVLVNRLNVRSGPGTRYDLIGTLNRGQTIPLVGYRDATGTWTMVNYNGQNRWVSALPGYLQTTVPIANMPVWTASGSGALPAGTPLATVGSRVSALNVRSGPDTSFNIITALRAGTVVGMVGQNAASSWVEVLTSTGVRGWVSAPFIIPTTPIGNLPITG